MLGLVLAYGLLLALAHTKGGLYILELLHGAEKAALVVTSRAKQRFADPDLSLQEFCAACCPTNYYSDDSGSNVLQAMGMMATMWLSVYALTLFVLGFGNPRHFLLLPPLYYLPHWLGRVWFRKDLPSLDSYAQTPRGWLMGEACAWRELFQGRTVRSQGEFLACLGVTVLLLGGLMAYGGLYPSEKRIPRRKRRKRD